MAPLLLALVSLASAPAPAAIAHSSRVEAPRASGGDDVLVLKSGRRLRGTLEQENDLELTFVTDDGKRLVLTWPLIRSVERGETPSTNPPNGDTAPDSYVEYRPPNGDTPGALMTKITRWSRDDGTEIHLVGAVHIGEEPYFRGLQKRLDQMDVVLFEGVRPAEGAELSADDLESMDAITQLQLALRDALGLRFQKDFMRTDRPFWVNADTDVVTLQRELDRRNVTLPTDNPLMRILMKVALGGLDPELAKSDPRMAQRLRQQLAPVLAKAESYLEGGAMRGFAEVVLEFRNDVAYDVLIRTLGSGPDGRRIALFYGSAHLRDFAERLADAGWSYGGTESLDAWTIR